MATCCFCAVGLEGPGTKARRHGGTKVGRTKARRQPVVRRGDGGVGDGRRRGRVGCLAGTYADVKDLHGRGIRVRRQHLHNMPGDRFAGRNEETQKRQNVEIEGRRRNWGRTPGARCRVASVVPRERIRTGGWCEMGISHQRQFSVLGGRGSRRASSALGTRHGEFGPWRSGAVAVY